MRRLISVLTIITLTFLLAGILASCSGTAAPDILATSTILADITRNVAGERLTVGSLVPIGTDPHSYQPTPQDTARLTKSKVLVFNGAGYETFLEAQLANAEGQRTLIEASASLSLRTEAQDGHGFDPHLWLDPNNVIV